MSEHLESRVTRLEVRVDGHEKDITGLKEESSTLSEALTAIKSNLSQIKWIAVGAAVAFGVQYIGLPRLFEMVVERIIG